MPEEPDEAEPSLETVTPATVVDRRTKGPTGERAVERAAEGTNERTPPRVEEPPIAGGSETRSLQTTGPSARSPLEALDHAELDRTRMFAFVVLGIAIVFGVVVPFLPAQGVIITRLTYVGIAVTALAMVYLIYRTSHPATFGDGYGVLVAWYLPAFTVAAAMAFGGPASPVCALAVFGIYIIGMGSRMVIAAGVYATTALAQLVTSIIVISGTADIGLVKSGDLPTYVQVLIQVVIQIVLAATFITARASRRSSLRAFGELERAVRAVAQREALLEEARDELRRALGTGRGRFTDQVIGEYRLGELIGRGAMGEVYDAIHVRSGVAVAIKMLTLTSLGNVHHVQRFLRELKTSSTIASPNVVRVLTIGEEPLPHLVMERLRGRELSTILREKRTLPPADVVELVRQVGAGITAARAAGVIHRDLKPQNLLLADGTWKVLDFGVSRLADASDTLTAGHVVGTPSYMAPEQARGGEVDHRSDLYSLAAVAYRALTGHAPFGGGEVVDVLYRVVHERPRRPSVLAKLPAEVDYVLAIGLAKRPSDRFATAADLGDALEAALAGELPEPIRRRGAELAERGSWARARTPPL